MFHNIFSSHVIFRIINGAAFFGFFAFLFKRHMLPKIKKQIQEKKLLLQNLEQQKQGIKYQQSNLDNAIEQQAHLAAELNKKIDLWRIKVAEQQKLDYEKEKLLLEKMQEKAIIQNQKQALIQLNKKIVPQVLINVEQSLIQHFAQNDYDQQFIKEIVTFIQESNR